MNNNNLMYNNTPGQKHVGMNRVNKNNSCMKPFASG